MSWDKALDREIDTTLIRFDSDDCEDTKAVPTFNPIEQYS
jgi:hypothetical protein